MTGQQSATGATHGAADPEQVDVPAPGEEGIRDGHNSRITRIPPGCPPCVRDMDSSRPHIPANPRGRVGIPGSRGLIPVNCAGAPLPLLPRTNDAVKPPLIPIILIGFILDGSS
jgi:hypothetical protein